MNANGPVVRRMIRDSLRYWVHDMHVDGFRFDLASVFSRDETGLPIPDPPILYDIESDPVLAGTRLIAEAWDAGGLYQVGHFAGDRWVEWNGRFRDDVRSFVRGDPGMGWPLVQRFTGSPDLYGHKDPDTESSLNFVTCHDGFTLHDLVAYDRKHNDANGEGGRDGSDLNVSWNHGVEGPTDDPESLLRSGRSATSWPSTCCPSVSRCCSWATRPADPGRQQQRLRAGRPDELVRLDPAGARSRPASVHEGPHRPATAALELFETDEPELHGVRLGEPDLGPDSRSIAMTFRSDRQAAHVICNAYWDALDFELPDPGEGREWRMVVDTHDRRRTTWSCAARTRRGGWLVPRRAALGGGPGHGARQPRDASPASVRPNPALCLALPGTSERLSHGAATWFVGKRTFVSAADRGHDDRRALWLAAAAGIQESLVETDPDRFFRPPYVGHAAGSVCTWTCRPTGTSSRRSSSTPTA